MGCEIELKYTPSGDFSASALFDHPLISKNREELRRITMSTEYLDTPDRLARESGITLRCRKENGKSVFCVKCQRARHGAFSERGEWSVESEDLSSALPLLKECGAPVERLFEKPLLTVAKVSFLRLECDVNLGFLSFVLSYDEGFFGESTPFSEIELELVSGDAAELIVVGERLKREFDLKDEPRSKYARALLYND